MPVFFSFLFDFSALLEFAMNFGPVLLFISFLLTSGRFASPSHFVAAMHENSAKERAAIWTEISMHYIRNLNCSTSTRFAPLDQCVEMQRTSTSNFNVYVAEAKKGKVPI